MSVYEVDRDADALVLLSLDAHRPSILGKRQANGEPNGVSDLRIKVSSKHLSLASRYYRTHFASPPTADDGRVHVRLEGFDPAAVKAVLDIIHSRGFRAPRSLDLPALARVAAFVDAFEAHEAVEAYADRWISQIQNTATSDDPERLGRWILVSSVFGRPDLFREATRAAIARSTGPVSVADLPVPESIIQTIEDQRQGLIAKTATALQRVADELRDGVGGCRQGCDAFLLGILARALHRWRQALTPPYAGVSFHALAEAVRDLQAQVWYVRPVAVADLGGKQEKKEASLEARFPEHYCTTRGVINPTLYSLEVSIVGLELGKKLY